MVTSAFRWLAGLGLVILAAVFARAGEPRPVVAADFNHRATVVSGAVAARTRPEGPRRWLTRPVRFDVQQRPILDFLRDFCAAQGVAFESHGTPIGSVTGLFRAEDPGEILDAVVAGQRLHWYFDGMVAHFFGDEGLETRFFPLRGVDETDLRRMLERFELFDSRFPWRVDEGGGVLMAQGPAVYLDHIAEMRARCEEILAVADAQRELGVFRLKYAWATEQTITLGSGQTTLPGVADLLRRIVEAEPTVALAGSVQRVGIPRRMKGNGVIGRRAGEAAAPPGPAAPADAGDGDAPSTGDRPFIEADTRLNAVLVWDYPANMKRWRALIEAMDQPLALVEIRAAIMDVETDRMRDLGIAWEYSREGRQWTQNASANLGALEGIAGDGFQYATIFTHGLDRLMLRVGALEKDGNANILSRPSVLTQDHIQATLEHTETFYVRLQGTDEVDLADIKTGLTLRVTPHVIPNTEGEPAKIQLAVYITSGSDNDADGAKVDSLPTVRQSTISTQAVVHEGEALVIGGTYAEARQVDHSGVPVLKNLPGLGMLFRRKGSTFTKSERLFVLSPRIVRPGASPIGAGTEAERVFDAGPARTILGAPALDDTFPLAVPNPGATRPFFRRGP